jgi:hypothetical protein
MQWDIFRRVAARACDQERRARARLFGLKRFEYLLLLKYLTGMGSPKTALGLMTPVA